MSLLGRRVTRECFPMISTEPRMLQTVEARHTKFDLPISPSSFDRDLERFAARCRETWLRAPTSLPSFGEPVPELEKQRRRRSTDRFVDTFEARLRRVDKKRMKEVLSDPEIAPWQHRLRDDLRRFLSESLKLSPAQQRMILSDDFFNATVDFIRQARAFDSGLGASALSQALRNVWIMHCFQLFLKCPVASSPSITAYSLLYPYTDNFLDDPEISFAEKERFGRRLGERLGGEVFEPEGKHEDAVFRLIEQIEEEYPRAGFPEVYHGVSAIHRAQSRSLAQQAGARSCPSDLEILDLSIAKGGASVLADAYLVAGSLTPEEASFFFAYGVFLQLADDLQDVEEDLKAGHRTLFSSRAGVEPLDHDVNRLVHFLDAALTSERFSDPFSSETYYVELKSLLRSSCIQLVLQSAALHPEYFSAPYLEALERYSSVDFAYLRAKHGEISERFRWISAKAE